MARITKTPETTKPVEAAKPAANPPVTFDVNDPALQAMLAQAVAVALAAQRAEIVTSLPAKAATTKISIAGKTEQQIKNEIATVRAFKKIGINATPHVDTFTFNKWIAKGMRPKEGAKSIRVNQLRLFHKSQCRPISPEEMKAMKEQSQAAVARHEQASKPASTAKGNKVVAFKGQAEMPL